MKALKHSVDTALAWIVIVLMGAMAIDILWQVFTRFVLNNPSQYTEEIARYLLIWLGLLGAAFVMSKRMHLAIDVLLRKLDATPRLYLDLFIQFFTALFAVVVMVMGGARLVHITLSLQQISAALQIPLGYVYLAVPISGALIAFYAVLFMVDAIRGLTGREMLLQEQPAVAAVD